MVPEILSTTDRIFCHFGQFFALLPAKNPKNQNFKKMKKTPGNIIISQKYNKNHDHMLYCSWDMAHDGCNYYFSFWAIFCPFTPLTAQKMKISKKWKSNTWRYHHFPHVHQNHDHMLYCSWDMACDRCNCYFSFWAIFCPFTP